MWQLPYEVLSSGCFSSIARVSLLRGYWASMLLAVWLYEILHEQRVQYHRGIMLIWTRQTYFRIPGPVSKRQCTANQGMSDILCPLLTTRHNVSSVTLSSDHPSTAYFAHSYSLSGQVGSDNILWHLLVSTAGRYQRIRLQDQTHWTGSSDEWQLVVRNH